MRKTGYYWVKFKDDNKWVVGHYEQPADVEYPSSCSWSSIACDEYFEENELQIIGNPIVPPK